MAESIGEVVQSAARLGPTKKIIENREWSRNSSRGAVWAMGTVVLAFIVAIPAYAQGAETAPFVSFEGAKLRLGMTVGQAQVTLRASSLYLVRIPSAQPDPNDLWTVLNHPTLDKGWVSKGIVRVTNAHIESITKPWDSDSSSGSYEEILFYLLKTFVEENHSSCTISTEEKSSILEDSKTAWVVCGQKTIKISSMRSKSDHPFQISGVDEVLAR